MIRLSTQNQWLSTKINTNSTRRLSVISCDLHTYMLNAFLTWNCIANSFTEHRKWIEKSDTSNKQTHCHTVANRINKKQQQQLTYKKCTRSQYLQSVHVYATATLLAQLNGVDILFCWNQHKIKRNWTKVCVCVCAMHVWLKMIMVTGINWMSTDVYWSMGVYAHARAYMKARYI